MKQTEVQLLLSSQLKDYISAHGLNHTNERYEILKAALTLDEESTPFSARTLYKRYTELGGVATRGCIYDTLEILEQAGIVMRVPALVGTGIGYLFGYHFSNSVAVLCLYCGKIQLHKRARFTRALLAAKPPQTDIAGAAVFMYGTCKHCGRKENKIKKPNSRA